MYVSLLPLKKIKENTVHRGQILKKAVSESEFSVTDIVRLLKYSSRNTYYNHIKDASLPLAILKRYSKLLHYDFSEEIPEMMEKNIVEEDQASILTRPVDIKEATSQRNYYHRLYLDLLEKLRKLEDENANLKIELEGKKNAKSKSTHDT